MIVKGGRTTNSELERMKDRGNLHFTQLEYIQAIACYTQAFDMDPDAEFRLILHSNTAECFLKLRDYAQAETESTKALSLNPVHAKSLLRRARACKMLGKFRQAFIDLDAALEIDSTNSAVLTEKGQVVKRQNKAKRLIVEAMTSRSRAPTLELSEVKVVDVGSEEPKAKSVHIEEVKKMAIDNLPVKMLGQPKTLTELEKNWATLQDHPEKLMSYLTALDLELLTKLCAKGSIESDFLMRVVKTIEDYML